MCAFRAVGTEQSVDMAFLFCLQLSSVTYRALCVGLRTHRTFPHLFGTFIGVWGNERGRNLKQPVTVLPQSRVESNDVMHNNAPLTPTPFM